ncbi:anthranilate O-methyltransferase 1-like isoform X2 [Typha latifolia]
MSKSIVELAISEIFMTHLPERMVMVDLGCSTGPNTFLLVSEAIDVVGDLCRKLGCQQPPELQFFLNDLPKNDFNRVFQYLEFYEDKFKEDKGEEKLVPHYVVASPGSFYSRLFPRHSVHFFHSSYCLMWLSKVPEGLEGKNGSPLNEGNIYVGSTSPPCVLDSYKKQFQKDFALFLQLRFKELVPGGQMVFTTIGRKELHLLKKGVACVWELVAEALHSMVSQGFVEKGNLDSFNLPFYAPCMEEVKEVIQQTGLFDISRSQILEINVDPHDDSDDDFVRDNIQSGKNAMKTLRAVIEPIVACQFGEEILDELFSRLENNLARQLSKEKIKYTTLVLALKGKICAAAK